MATAEIMTLTEREKTLLMYCRESADNLKKVEALIEENTPSNVVELNHFLRYNKEKMKGSAT